MKQFIVSLVVKETPMKRLRAALAHFGRTIKCPRCGMENNAMNAICRGCGWPL